MKILVTGARGFIGSHICEYFSNKNYGVVGWDTIKLWNKKYIINQVDLLDNQNVLVELKKEKPDLIIHCAGVADVSKSIESPYFDYEGNVTITHNLIFALHKAKLVECRFLFLSSAAVYGNPASLPIKENAPLSPLSPYALHKVMCEEICRFGVKRYNQDIKILRIFSAYGEGLKKQIFWDMFHKADRNKRLDMFGSGLESRDYIHIEDLVKAVDLVSIKAPRSELVFNIGNGVEVAIKEVTELFANAFGIELGKIAFTGEILEGNPIHWKADISKLRALGYIGKVSMEEGIKKYVDWLKG